MQVAASALTSGRPSPMVDLQLSVRNAAATANAWMSYFFEIVPVNPAVPITEVVSVPVNVTYNASVSIQGYFGAASATLPDGTMIALSNQTIGIPQPGDLHLSKDVSRHTRLWYKPV